MHKIKTLFLASNPKNTARLAIDEEIREITYKIRLSDGRDVLDVLSAWAVRPDDLLQYLNQHKPQIVHFSGHGSSTGEIILEDKNGNAKAVSPQALKTLFTTLKDNIQIVVLNACYSNIQAKAINKVIDYVIGMNTTIGDDAAIIFAASFYRALGFDRTVQEAFDQAKTALLLEGIPEENTPRLLARTNVSTHKKLTILSESGQASTEDAPLRLVDISIEEPDKSYPILDVKLRNIGKEVVFLKRAEFHIMKIGELINPQRASYSLERVSWNYDVQFTTKHEGISIDYGISQSIKSNAVDRFTFTISHGSGDPIFPTLFYFTLTLIYNEDDKKIVSQPIILPIPSNVTWGGMAVRGFDESIAQRDIDILKEFSKLEGLSSKKFKKLIENNLK